MTDRFYTEFEASFRGTRELIMDRLRVYDDFLQPLLKVFPNAEVVDLGCGRGEWIEKMQSMGFSPRGVDLDQGMLQSCWDRGFEVHLGDALEYLAALPDNSQAVVSAFHLVEHLPFSEVQYLIGEALRVLKPAGLLIMETPNPENLIVATRNFYLDPTHQRPMPPELLTYLPKMIGCERVKLVRLQESEALRFNTMPTLADVIGGASPDYAVITQKNADEDILQNWDKVFSKEYGLSLKTLLDRYDHNNSLQLSVLHSKVNLIEAQLLKALELVESANKKCHSLEVTVQSTRAQIQSEIAVIYTSKSWRITAPLRWINFQRKLIIQHGLARRIGVLFNKVSQLFSNHIIVVNFPKNQTQNVSSKLTPRAKIIRDDLVRAIKDRGEG